MSGPANPPGRRQLAYRVGTYDSFARRMVDRLVMTLEHEAGELAVDGRSRQAGLTVRLNLDEADHWLLALCRSWATVADVLTFYQERLIQEGYLRTAVEERSVHELVHMVGYRPLPGVAGSTWLAVRVTDVEGLPRQVELPARLVVRSKPPPGAEPLVFETAEPLEARAAWNELPYTPRRVRRPPRVSAGAGALDLAGAVSGLAPGAPLLVTARAGGRELRRFVHLTAVEAVAGEEPATRVGWQGPLAPEMGDAALAEVEVATFARRSALFGHNAPPWSSLPPEERRRVQPLEGGVLLFDGGAWHSRNRGLPSTTRVLSLAADDAGHLYAGTAGQGVFRSTDGGASWEAASRGLQQLDVRALAVGRRGVLYAGTAGGGVYRSTDRAAVWEPADGADALLTGPAGRGGWWPRRRRPPRGGRLPQSPVRALLDVSWQGRRVVLAGTDVGVFRSTDAGRRWQPANRGLPGADEEVGTADPAVESLAAGPAPGLLFAGTSAGVFRSTDAGRRWQPVNRGLPATDPFRGVSTTRVHAVAVLAQRHGSGWSLLAGTPRGVYRFDAGDERWRAVALSASSLAEEVAVTGLAVWEDPVTLERRVFAATAAGPWESSDDGASWQPVEPFAPGPVEALAAGAGAAPALAATPFGSFADEWPGFHVRGGHVDLDGVVDGAVPGSWLVLEPVPAEDETAAEPVVRRVRKVSAVQRTDFGLSATVTRLEVDPDPRLAELDLRHTRAWVESEPLPLAPRVEVDHGSALEVLRVALDGLDPTRRVIAAGLTPPRVLHRVLGRRPLAEDLLELCRELAAVRTVEPLRVRVWSGEVEADGAAGEAPAIDLHSEPADLVHLLGTLAGERQAGRDYGWLMGEGRERRHPRGGDGDGELGRFLEGIGADEGVVSLRVDVPGRPDGAVLTAAEMAAALRRASPDDDSLTLPAAEGDEAPRLTLASLRLHANVVAAVEGVTVAGEVLGDGDATRRNQAFPLANPPNFRRGAAGPEASVGVRVQGQRWHPVRRLYEAAGDRRAFRLDVDHEGAARVVFGDGERGARLPTGRDNVVATYRTGMTTRGAPADGVTLIESRPLGLEGVSNPLPTTPGAGCEPAQGVRRRAPGSVRTLERVVSLGDYADYSRRFPGVVRAGAWALPGPGGAAVQVTVAAEGGRPPEPGDDLLVELRAALEEHRATRRPLVLQGYRRVEVDLWAGVHLHPDFLWDDVETRLRRALAEAFGFRRSRFGGAVSEAAVVRTMQRVRGVVAVDLDDLSGAAAAGEGPRERRARPPRRLPDGTVRPAELVVLGDVRLERREAP